MASSSIAIGEMRLDRLEEELETMKEGQEVLEGEKKELRTQLAKEQDAHKASKDILKDAERAITVAKEDAAMELEKKLYESSKKQKDTMDEAVRELREKLEEEGRQVSALTEAAERKVGDVAALEGREVALQQQLEESKNALEGEKDARRDAEAQIKLAIVTQEAAEGAAAERQRQLDELEQKYASAEQEHSRCRFAEVEIKHALEAELAKQNRSLELVEKEFETLKVTLEEIQPNPNPNWTLKVTLEEIQGDLQKEVKALKGDLNQSSQEKDAVEKARELLEENLKKERGIGVELQSQINVLEAARDNMEKEKLKRDASTVELNKREAEDKALLEEALEQEKEAVMSAKADSVLKMRRHCACRMILLKETANRFLAQQGIHRWNVRSTLSKNMEATRKQESNKEALSEELDAVEAELKEARERIESMVSSMVPKEDLMQATAELNARRGIMANNERMIHILRDGENIMEVQEVLIASYTASSDKCQDIVVKKELEEQVERVFGDVMAVNAAFEAMDQMLDGGASSILADSAGA